MKKKVQLYKKVLLKFLPCPCHGIILSILYKYTQISKSHLALTFMQLETRHHHHAMQARGKLVCA